MIFTSKTTKTHCNLKIWRPKVTKNIKNLHKKFCEFPPRFLFLIFPVICILRQRFLPLSNCAPDLRILKILFYNSNLEKNRLNYFSVSWDLNNKFRTENFLSFEMRTSWQLCSVWCSSAFFIHFKLFFLSNISRTLAD